MQKEEPETNKVQITEIRQCKSFRFRNELSKAFGNSGYSETNKVGGKIRNGIESS